MGNSAFLSIADFQLELLSEDETKIAFDEGFDQFKCEKSTEIHTTIRCFSSVPFRLLTPRKSVYKAQSKTELFWEIFEHVDGLQFMVYDPENTTELQQVAIYEEKAQNWRIYCPHKIENGTAVMYPLSYPLAPLILYYLTVHHDAIMIHASGVYDGKEGRIFSGFSGVGKSTLAQLWNQKESMVINDDRLILRKIDKEYWMYNTPMYYPDDNKRTPLNRVYLPFHHVQNTYQVLKGVSAIAELMAFCIQHGFRRSNTEAHFNFISEMTQQLTVAKIGVVPTTAIVDFIRANEEKLAK